MDMHTITSRRSLVVMVLCGKQIISLFIMIFEMFVGCLFRNIISFCPSSSLHLQCITVDLLFSDVVVKFFS